MMDRSEMAILVFDSQCVLCDGGVRYTLKHERQPSIRFVAIQSEEGRALANLQGVDPDDPSSFLFIDQGRAVQKSDAVIAMAKHLNGIARLAPVAKLVPKMIRDRIYDLIAKNRYRVFGRLEICMRPPPEQRGRFTL